MRVAIFNVGFDEKLVLRAAFRVGVQPGDTVLLVYAITGGDYERNRVSKAVETLRGVFNSAGVGLRELSLEADDFGRDVASIVKTLRELNPKVVSLSLGSGMRYIGVAILYASLLYREFFRDIELFLHVSREDGLYDVIVNADTLRLSIGKGELNIVCRLNRPAPRDVFVKEVSSALEKSLSTIYSLIYRMVERGFISLNNGTIQLTPLGEAVAKSVCGDRVE